MFGLSKKNSHLDDTIIYGHIDAFLRTRGYDMADSEMSVPLTFHVVRKLFPAGNPNGHIGVHRETASHVRYETLGVQPFRY
jgi:hypothetical protein